MLICGAPEAGAGWVMAFLGKGAVHKVQHKEHVVALVHAANVQAEVRAWPCIRRECVIAQLSCSASGAV